MRFSLKRCLALLILIPFLLSGYAYALAEEGEAEGKKEEPAAEEIKKEEPAPAPTEVKPEETAPAPKGEEAAPAPKGEEGKKEESGIGEKGAKGFFESYIVPTDYAISKAFLRLSPFESPAVTNFRLLGKQIDYLTESIPGLEIQGMFKNRTWINSHGISGYTSGGGDLTGGSWDTLPCPHGLTFATVSGANVCQQKQPDGKFKTIKPADPRALTPAQRLSALGNKGRRTSQFNMIEMLPELRVRYTVNPNISFHSVFDYRYDPTYDWDHNHVMDGFDRPFPDEIDVRRFGSTTKPQALAIGQAIGQVRHQLMNKVEREQSYYRDTKQILRELYTDIILPSSDNGTLSFRLGKQQVGLGKQDFNVIDIVTQSFNNVTPASDSPNLEWDRLPTWMANMAYTFPERILPGVSMRFLWIPDWEPAYPNQRAGAPNWGRGRPLIRTDLANPSRIIFTRFIDPVSKKLIALGPGTATGGANNTSPKTLPKSPTNPEGFDSTKYVLKQVGVAPSPPTDNPHEWSIQGSEWAFNTEVAGPLHGKQWLPVLGEGWQTGLWWLSDFEGAATNFRRGSDCLEADLKTGCKVIKNPDGSIKTDEFANPTNWKVDPVRRNELKPTRKEHFMWGTDKNFYWAGRYWLFKWEQNFTFGIYQADNSESNSTTTLKTALPFLRPLPNPNKDAAITAKNAKRLSALNALAVRNAKFEDGFMRANRMDTGVTLSTKFFTHLDFTLFYIRNQWLTRPFKSNTPRDQADVLLWNLRYPLQGTEDRLAPSVTTYVSLAGPASWRQQIVLGYDLGENTKLSFEYVWFSGASDTTYGGWNDWDQFRLKVQHKF